MEGASVEVESVEAFRARSKAVSERAVRAAVAKCREIDPARLAAIKLQIIRYAVGLTARLPRAAREEIDTLVVARARDGGERLGAVYESMLDLELHDRAGGYRLANKSLSRKRSGAYYSAPALARPLVERCLAPLVYADMESGTLLPPDRILRLRVCDPAMGGGAFLVAALRFLAEKFEASLEQHGSAPRPAHALRAQVAEHCIRGVDLDPHAVEVARLALWLEVGCPRFRPEQLRGLVVGDAILSTWTGQGQQPGHRGLQWDVAFPGVFDHGGFDAVVGNPPWETLKPNSKEFFSTFDPEYRHLGRKEALKRREQLFRARPEIERRWAGYVDSFKQVERWIKASGRDGDRPFRHQGSADRNSYKLFLELGVALLRQGGRLGMLTPAAVYSDYGSRELRRLFLDRCRWEWLVSFENRENLFPIDSRFKFCAIVLCKGGATRTIKTAFMCRKPEQLDRAEHVVFDYPRERIAGLSSAGDTLLELRGPRDLQVLSRLADRGEPISSAAWALRYCREFDMALDAGLFRARPELEAEGFARTERGVWCDRRGELAYPLFEGRMIGPLAIGTKGWVSGRARSAKWREITAGNPFEPQYLVLARDLEHAKKFLPEPKVAFMRVSSATNSRTMIATYLGGFPTGDSLFLYRSERKSLIDCLLVAGVLSTFGFDFQARMRLGGLNMSEFVLRDAVLPRRERVVEQQHVLLRHIAGLALCSASFAREWAELGERFGISESWALDPSDRLRRRCILEALVAELYELGERDLRWILRDCDLPRPALADRAVRAQLDPRGYWRIDKHKDPHSRFPVLALAAFADLTRTIRSDGRGRGIAKFSRDWELPA